MSNMTVPPPGANRQCVSYAEASEIIHGIYPLSHLEERLDHVDACDDCSDKFRVIVALVVARLEQLGAP